MAGEGSGTKIELTRGDTYIQQLNIRINGEPYTLQDGDEVSFAVKRNKLKSDRSDYIDDEPLILKNLELNDEDKLILQLDPEDTKPLAFDTYVYDIEIKFSDGAVYTVIKKAVFKLTEEVH